MAVGALEIVNLDGIIGRQLDPLLLEETVEWERELDWDFSRSAELVRHFTDGKALAGAALLDLGEVVGYGYAVLEDNKALIGDVYVRPAWRGGGKDDPQVRLFRTILDSLTETAGLRRIESQLMMIDPAIGEALRRERPIDTCERILMATDAGPLPVTGTNGRFRVEGWSDQYQELAATVIALSYANHVDSRINEQYRSVAGARRFLTNIVQYPGCGTFFRPGSLVAFDVASGWVAGVVLTSFVGPRTGHITQLGVTPQAQGQGLGRELLLRAMDALYRNGARRVSLTVTAANAGAVALYKQAGFVEMRRFLAYMWERR